LFRQLLSQLHLASLGGVLGAPLLHGANRRLFDDLGGIEIGLACPKTNHVSAFALERGRLGRNCQRGRSADPPYTIR
jgi:hypothetical protein